MVPQDFVNKFLPYALKTQQKTGISAIFILAQAALESGWGERIPGNMFFGVKASKNTPESKRQLLITTEIFSKDSPEIRSKFPAVLSVTKREDGKYVYKVKDWFRKYDTPEECFTEHGTFFLVNKRYTNAIKVKHDPYKFATEVAKAGYATGTKYADTLHKLIDVIKKYV